MLDGDRLHPAGCRPEIRPARQRGHNYEHGNGVCRYRWFSDIARKDERNGDIRMRSDAVGDAGGSDREPTQGQSRGGPSGVSRFNKYHYLMTIPGSCRNQLAIIRPRSQNQEITAEIR